MNRDTIGGRSKCNGLRIRLVTMPYYAFSPEIPELGKMDPHNLAQQASDTLKSLNKVSHMSEYLYPGGIRIRANRRIMKP